MHRFRLLLLGHAALVLGAGCSPVPPPSAPPSTPRPTPPPAVEPTAGAACVAQMSPSEHALATVQREPGLSGFRVLHRASPPFVLAYALPAGPLDDAARERARRRLDRMEAVARDLVPYFQRTWVDGLGLRPLPADARVVTWVFDDPADLRRVVPADALPTGRVAHGFTRVSDRTAFLAKPPLELVTFEALLAHEMTHQLQHLLAGSFGRDVDQPAALPVWLLEGWAEHVAACERLGERWSFGRSSPVRGAQIERLRGSGIPDPPLALLLSARDMDHWAELYEGHLREVRPAVMAQFSEHGLSPVLRAAAADVLYAHSWELFERLQNGAEATDRERLARYVRSCLRDFSEVSVAEGRVPAVEAFRRHWELEAPADWAALERRLRGEPAAVVDAAAGPR